jgi:menaquinone-dependent protoporphyrinogen oxidase
MKLAIIYATTEGQTRKIARFCLSQLSAEGHSAELVPASEAGDLDVGSYDAVILSGSVHVGHYQSDLVDVVRDKAEALGGRPSLFLSVSLAAAGEQPEDLDDLKHYADGFRSATGFAPGRVEHVAGAIRFSDYDFFKYWAMRWMAAKRDEPVKAGQDREYTDWDALAGVLKDWTQGISAGT